MHTRTRNRSARRCFAALAALAALPAGAHSLPDTPYNVIFYVLDTTRADHLSLYGYQRETTPFLDQLATEGVAWSSAHSSGTWTWPSVASMLTGLSVETHRVVEDALALPSTVPNLPSILADAGYDTHLLTSNPMLAPAGRAGCYFQHCSFTARPDQNLTDQIETIIRDPGARPFFIHAQPFAAHAPYDCPAPFDDLFVGDPFYGGLGDAPLTSGRSCVAAMRDDQVIDGILSMDWYVAEYDGLIAYMDDQIRRLFVMLDEEGLRESTLVVITADHGEELHGDHNYYFCHIDHFEGNSRIPLLMIFPEDWQRRHGPARDLMLAGNPDLADLLPTTLEVLGMAIPPGIQGRNLIHDPEPRASIQEGRAFRALVDGSMKLIHRAEDLDHSDNNKLFDLAVDPHEQHNLADSLTHETQRMEDDLLRVARALDAVRPPQPEGTILAVDFEDPIQNEGYVCISRFERAWAVVAENDTNHVIAARIGPHSGAIQYLASVAVITEPLWDYDLNCRFTLESGTLSVQTRWVQWFDRGYRLHLSAGGAQLLRNVARGFSEELARVPMTISPGDWHRLELRSDGHTVSVAIDGQSIIRVRDEIPQAWGGTHFAVPSSGGAACVDDIVISRPATVIGTDLDLARRISAP